VAQEIVQRLQPLEAGGADQVQGAQRVRNEAVFSSCPLAPATRPFIYRPGPLAF